MSQVLDAELPEIHAVFHRRARNWLIAWRNGEGATVDVRVEARKLQCLAEMIFDEPVTGPRHLIETLKVVAFFDGDRPWVQDMTAEFAFPPSTYRSYLFALQRAGRRVICALD